MAGDPPAADAQPHLHFSDEALENLGVAYDELMLGSTSVHRSVVATVVDAPRTEQPVQAPVGGVVIELLTRPGLVVRAGDQIARMVREPIRPPVLELVEEYAAPAHTEVHLAIRELREAHAETEIAKAELERIARFTGSEEEAPLLPLQRRIDLEYQLRRAQVGGEVAAHELERHGFSDAQIEGLVSGEHVELFDAEHTRRALVHGDLWRGHSDRLLAALPDALRELPIHVATIAELTGRGLGSSALCAWLESDPNAAKRFPEIASLLLDGASFDDVRRLARLGALDASLVLVAPDGPPDWDVAALVALPGDHVSAGAAVARLRDARTPHLRIEPVGSEVAILARAAKESLRCRAVPLVAGAGPELEDVRIDYLATTGGADPRPVAWARLINEEVSPDADAGQPFRTWALQPGRRYRLLVPTLVLDDVFVLPRTAVAEDGPDRIVFVPAGDGGFEEVPVVVAHEDETQIVIRPNDALPPGTRIVVRGAFELGLAMHAGDRGMEHDHGH